MILLFTDFGASDIYLGQLKAVLQRRAPAVAVIDLLHDAPTLNVRAAAHLLAALVPQFDESSVFLAVVDPGVGGERRAVAVQADGKWLVGPDNGLLSVVAARAREARVWRIAWRPQHLSNSFHGRDLFAPLAAQLARGEFPADKLELIAALQTDFGAGDLPEIIYLDHYGNAFTGMRAAALPRSADLAVAGQRLCYAEVFARVPSGAAFWYENSLGLAEVAVNCGSAAQQLGLHIGQRIESEVP